MRSASFLHVWKAVFLLTALLLPSLELQAAQPVSPDSVEKEIAATDMLNRAEKDLSAFEAMQKLILSEGLSPEHSALVVVDVSHPSLCNDDEGEEYPKELFAYNPDKLLSTASVMKLFTSAAALHYMKPEYQFSTMLASKEEMKKGRIAGHLYLKAGADPFFVPEQMSAFIREIVLTGLKRVDGNLMIDLSCHEGPSHPPGWSEENFDKSYSSRLSSLTYAFNSVAVKVMADGETGERPTVLLDPPAPGLKVKNSAIIKEKGRNGIEIKVVPTKGGERIEVTGRIGHGKSYSRFLPVHDPIQYFARSLKAELKRAGISLRGGVRFGPVPEDAVELMTHKGQPLAVLTRSLNIYSNNLMAELILRQLGAEVKGYPGSTEKGIETVREFLSELGLDPAGLSQTDGSGLSRDSRASARMVTRLLATMVHRMDIGPDYLASLSTTGGEGSLSKHLIEPGYYRHIRAKTGFIDNVFTLAGYVRTHDGRTLAFCILLNEVSRKYRDTWDNIIDGVNRLLVEM